MPDTVRSGVISILVLLIDHVSLVPLGQFDGRDYDRDVENISFRAGTPNALSGYGVQVFHVAPPVPLWWANTLPHPRKHWPYVNHVFKLDITFNIGVGKCLRP